MIQGNSWTRPFSSEPQLRAQPIERALLFGLMLLAVTLRLFFWGYTDRVWEDGLITIQHAENAARGFGLTHVQEDGRPLHGFTSPLSVLIPLAGELIRSGFGLTLIRAVSAVGGAAAVWLGVMIARRLGLAAPACLMVGGYLAIEHHQILWGMAGMETQVVVVCYLLAFFAYLKGNAFVTGLALGLCMLARPDAILLVGIVFAFELWNRLGGPWFRSICLTAAGFVTVYLPWIVFTTLYYGSPIPNTIVAKALGYDSGFGSQPLVGILKAMLYLKLRGTFSSLGPTFGGNGTGFIPLFGNHVISAIALFLLIAGIAVAAWKRDTSALPILLFPVVYCLYFTGFIRFIFGWYVVPVTAISSIGVGYGLDRCSRLVRDKRLRKWAVVSAAMIYMTTLAAALPQTFRAERNIQEFVENRGRKQMGVFLGSVMRPGETVGIECLGYAGYYSRQLVYDYPGLCSRTVVNFLKAHPDKRRLSATLEGLRPTYVVVRPKELESMADWLARDYRFVWSYQVPAADVARLLRPDRNTDLQFSVFKKK